MREGRSGVGPVTRFDASSFPVRIAAEVKGFDPRDWMDFKQARRMSRFSQLAVAAARQAIDDAGLQIGDHNRDDVAVVMNTGGGGLQEVAVGEVTLTTRGPDRVSPFMVPMMSPSMAACQISIQNGIRGPVITSVAACASGVQAFVEAQRLIEHGDVDVVIAGGTESAIMPVSFAALANMGALSKRNDEPERASRPFDAERDGFVFGEAAGVLVVEAAEHAEARGATILAEIAGGALTADAFHISAPEPSGYGATLAMQRAIRDAHLEAEQVEVVMAHGTSTALNDATETKAIRVAFGAHADNLAVTSNKSMVGHTLGAAGAISGLAAVLAIRDGVIPPTINYEHPDPACDLDYVPNAARNVAVDVAIVNGFGFGGQNAVSVYSRYAG
jgi:3-oxoacyl-[acyl-carrier-protein] synthase II